jgi:hypothetical protein
MAPPSSSSLTTVSCIWQHRRSSTPTGENLMITIKSVCETIQSGLCKEPDQNYLAASVVRDVQRAVDPNGTKQLNTAQAKEVIAFLMVVVATT